MKFHALKSSHSCTTPDATYDVFVGYPATPEQVRRTMAYCLNCAPFDETGIATVGHHAELYVGAHQLPENLPLLLRHDRLLGTDHPVRVLIRSTRNPYDDFEHEATARRTFTVLRAQRWPVVLTYRLLVVLDTAPGASAPATRRRPAG